MLVRIHPLCENQVQRLKMNILSLKAHTHLQLADSSPFKKVVNGENNPNFYFQASHMTSPCQLLCFETRIDDARHPKTLLVTHPVCKDLDRSRCAIHRLGVIFRQWQVSWCLHVERVLQKGAWIDGATHNPDQSGPVARRWARGRVWQMPCQTAKHMRDTILHISNTNLVIEARNGDLHRAG